MSALGIVREEPLLRGDCGRCHDCGGRLVRLLDGAEQCSGCSRVWRLLAHGWRGGVASGEVGACADLAACLPSPASGASPAVPSPLTVVATDGIAPAGPCSLAREADLVESEKAGTSVTYRLKVSVLEDTLLSFAETVGVGVGSRPGGKFKLATRRTK